MLERLLERCRFPEAGPVTLAVSGGPDSSAMVVLAAAAGLEIEVVHVDHELRPDSAGEAEVVRRLAGRVGARFRPVTARVEPGPNLEARARAARYGCLPPDVLTGHTADDQAETVLLNMMRGAALDGLAGIRATARRPLLALRRAETAGLCAELGLEVVDDPMNRDPAFRRNRVRHELLPLMDEISGRDVVPVIARQARVLAGDANLLDQLAADLDRADAKLLRRSPRPLAARVLRSWVREVTGHPPDRASLRRMWSVVDGDAKAAEIPGGYRFARTDNVLRLEAFAPDDQRS